MLGACDRDRDTEGRDRGVAGFEAVGTPVDVVFPLPSGVGDTLAGRGIGASARTVAGGRTPPAARGAGPVPGGE